MKSQLARLELDVRKERFNWAWDLERKAHERLSKAVLGGKSSEVPDLLRKWEDSVQGYKRALKELVKAQQAARGR
jgi:hypothetical protein